MKNWKDIDSSVLTKIRVPSDDFIREPSCGFEHVISIPEFTFLGDEDKPDFGKIQIWFYGNERDGIELKSLKNYIYQWRDTRVSYERAINVLYDHLVAVYQPQRVRIEIEFYPRGGISSKLVVDSDWACRGGSDKLWQSHGG